MLLGDGLYYNEGLPGGWPREENSPTSDSVEELLEVVEVLKAQRGRRLTNPGRGTPLPSLMPVPQ